MRNKISFSRCSGFTLIELLVAIAIISILATFLFANFAGVRERARDTQRKSDISSIRSDLETFRSDNSSYPPTAALVSCDVAYTYGSTTYIKKIPCDPLDKTKYQYDASPSSPACDVTTTACTTYTLYACLENGNDPQIDKDGTGAKINCSGSTTRWKMTVQSP